MSNMVSGISLASELIVVSSGLMTTKLKLRRIARTLFLLFQKKKKKKLLSLIFPLIHLVSYKITR